MRLGLGDNLDEDGVSILFVGREGRVDIDCGGLGEGLVWDGVDAMGGVGVQRREAAVSISGKVEIRFPCEHYRWN
jgi:hypothetical protein